VHIRRPYPQSDGPIAIADRAESKSSGHNA
jgi:hypothetical protein